MVVVRGACGGAQFISMDISIPYSSDVILPKPQVPPLENSLDIIIETFFLFFHQITDRYHYQPVVLSSLHRAPLCTDLLSNRSTKKEYTNPTTAINCYLFVKLDSPSFLAVFPYYLLGNESHDTILSSGSLKPTVQPKKPPQKCVLRFPPPVPNRPVVFLCPVTLITTHHEPTTTNQHVVEFILVYQKGRFRSFVVFFLCRCHNFEPKNQKRPNQKSKVDPLELLPDSGGLSLARSGL